MTDTLAKNEYGKQTQTDWKPHLYLTFEKERTQPSIDLIAKIPCEKPNRIIDVGCGPGNSTLLLKSRWEDSEITGIDNSNAMLTQAKKQCAQIKWLWADAAKDLSALGTFDLVFSNAVIQWIPNQHLLLHNLYQIINNGGFLAVQVPCVKTMPLHTELQKLISMPKWKPYFLSFTPPYTIHTADFYYDILCEWNKKIDLWETNYFHRMDNHKEIITWYCGSGLRPYLDCLKEEQAKNDFLADYENLLQGAYPIQKDRTVLFPFTRIFFVFQK